MTVLVAMRFAKRFSRPSHKGDKLFKRFRLAREVVSLLDMTLTPESRTSGHARLQQIEPAVLGGGLLVRRAARKRSEHGWGPPPIVIPRGL